MKNLKRKLILIALCAISLGLAGCSDPNEFQATYTTYNSNEDMSTFKVIESGNITRNGYSHYYVIMYDRDTMIEYVMFYSEGISFTPLYNEDGSYKRFED